MSGTTAAEGLRTVTPRTFAMGLGTMFRTMLAVWFVRWCKRQLIGNVRVDRYPGNRAGESPDVS